MFPLISTFCYEFTFKLYEFPSISRVIFLLCFLIDPSVQKPKFWGKRLNRFYLLVTGSDGRADLCPTWSSCRTARFGPACQIALQRHPASLPVHPVARNPARGLSQMNLSVATSPTSWRGPYHVRWSDEINSDRFDGYDDKPVALTSNRLERTT